MHEFWKRFEGEVVDGSFSLRELVTADDDSAVFLAAAAPAFFCRIKIARSPYVSSTTVAVPSGLPSSMTMISAAGCVWASTLSTARHIVLAARYAGIVLAVYRHGHDSPSLWFFCSLSRSSCLLNHGWCV